MRIPSSLIPQADLLHDVIQVVVAVNQGASTFQDIARYISKVDRQGRYYRLAAEIIGLIKNKQNHAVLTSLGKEIIESEDDIRKEKLTNAVINTLLFQRILPFLEQNKNGFTRHDFEIFIIDVTAPVGQSMIPRRVSTILSWLKELGLIREDGKKIIFTPIIMQTLPPIQYDLNEPLMPPHYTLREYVKVAKRIKSMKSYISREVNIIKNERASELHKELVDLIASRISRSGFIPKTNQLIDLATIANNQPIIFEMKTITHTNARSQIRKGISQLYEYRYLQARDQALLVLACTCALPRTESWLLNYLETDRDIHFIWDGDQNIFASSNTRKKLEFLW